MEVRRRNARQWGNAGGLELGETAEGRLRRVGVVVWRSGDELDGGPELDPELRGYGGSAAKCVVVERSRWPRPR